MSQQYNEALCERKPLIASCDCPVTVIGGVS